MKRTIYSLALSVLLLGCILAPGRARAQNRLPTPSSAQFAKKWDVRNFSHRLFDSLLRRHVKRGRVDYAGLRRSSMSLLREYQYRLANTNPAGLKGGKAARLAFWINAHNALALRLRLHRGRRAKSARRRVGRPARSRGSLLSFAVGGRWTTLAQIRSKIIWGQFHEPRALFALVGSADAGRPLRARAYTARKLAQRLRYATRRALSHPTHGVSLDRKKMVVLLPQLLSRYRKKFAGSRFKSAIAFVAAHLSNAQDATFIKANLAKVTVRYRPHP